MEKAVTYGCYGLISLINWVTILRKLFNRVLPEPPTEVKELLRKVNEATASGSWYDDSDIDALDRALTEAELENPGSTLKIYFEMFPELFELGCILISLSVSGYIMTLIGMFPVNPTLRLSVIGFIFGLLLSFSYLWLWFISRPRLR